MSGIRKEDLRDADVVDATELLSSGTTAFRTGVTVVSTTAATKRVVTSGVYNKNDRDQPTEVGDKVVLSGNAAGTYTVTEVVDDDTLVVSETIATSTGGTAEYRHPPGATKVGVSPTGLANSAATVLQTLLGDFDTKLTRSHNGGLATAVGTTSDPTTTSAAFIVMPQMSVDITTKGGIVLVLFGGSFNLQHQDHTEFALFRGGTIIADTTRRLNFISAAGALGLTAGSIPGTTGFVHATISGLAAGTYTIDVRWRAVSGTARAASTFRRLTAVEVL